MPLLPFVFLTNELHVLPTVTLQNGQPPPSIQITKYFFQLQVEDVKREFSEVQSMGTATTEEWLKGLDDRGKERRNDAARWERWESVGGITRMRDVEPHEVTTSATKFPATKAYIPPLPDGHNAAFQSLNSMQLPAKIPNQAHSLPQPIHVSFR